jgi:hypothetical protein
MYPFTHIDAFYQVSRYITKLNKSEAVPESQKIKEPISFRGTIKLHGTNSSVRHTKDGELISQSRTRVITPVSDNAGFAFFVEKKKDSILEICKIVRDSYGIDPSNDLIIYGEWIGCFSYHTPILLSDGTTMPIGKIVNEKKSIEVLSYNFKTNKVEPKKIINWFRGKSNNDWLEITVKRRHRGGKSTKLLVTKNHNFFVKENNSIVEKRAEDLSLEDTVFVIGKTLSYNQLEFLKGSLLGDSSFNDSNIEIVHSEDSQSFYNDFISNLLENITTKVTQKTSGFGSNMKKITIKSHPELSDLIESLNLNKDGKKPTKDYLDKLSPQSFAAWYMDDGNICSGSNDRQFQCELSTHGFGEECNNLISEWFNSHGYECYVCKSSEEIYNKDKNFYIRFNPKGSERFFRMIAPYVIKDFDYKLPEYIRKIPKIDWNVENPNIGIIETKILEIKKGNPRVESWHHERYDIEIEDNHNYFANKVLVHNSGIQKGMAINQLPEKQWVLFSFKVIDGEKENYIDIKPSFEEKFKKDNIFSVFDIPQWNITVDFENVESKENAVNQFTKLTDEVEKECPWAKQWNISGLGEGIVWQPIGKFWGDSNLFFKTKGEKHKNTSPKEHKEQLNPEILSTIEEFVKFALTPNRLNQGIDAIKEAGHSLELSSTGHYLKWVGNDVARECCLELEDNKLEWSQVAKAVNENARKYFHQMVQDSK